MDSRNLRATRRGGGLGRSWGGPIVLFATALAAGAGIASTRGLVRADDPGSSRYPADPVKTAPAHDDAAKPGATSKSSAPKIKVELELVIAGRQGSCDVEVKPAHSGCSFRAVKKHVDRDQKTLRIVIDDLVLNNADRDCAFAITLKEAGKPEKTMKRGMRLDPPSTVAADTPASVPKLICYLSSPSMTARVGGQPPRK